MNWHIKISANILSVTIIISLILTVLVASLLLVYYYSRQDELKYLIEEQLSENLQSGIELALADTTVNVEPADQQISLFGDEKDSITFHTELWGVFKLSVVKAFYNHFSKQKVFFHGPASGDYLNSCIYLADHKRILSVVGDTKLSGDIFLSGAGIRPGFLGQRGYDNRVLVEGQIKKSDPELPPLDSIIMRKAKNYLEQIGDTAWIKNNIRHLETDSVVQKFSDASLEYVYKEALYINSEKIDGHVIVYSTKKIQVSKEAKLDNILLVAPVIIFEKGFSGKIQAIADDSIIVSEDCRLNYPSALILIKKKSAPTQQMIRLRKRSLFNGVIVTTTSTDDNYGNYFEAEKGSVITGVIYNRGFTYVAGKVVGTILTDFFIYKASGIVYENYILDVEVNRRQLSKYFLVSPIFKIPGKNQVVQWLN